MTEELKKAWETGRSVANMKETVGMEYIGTVRRKNRYFKFFWDKENNEYRFWTWSE